MDQLERPALHQDDYELMIMTVMRETRLPTRSFTSPRTAFNWTGSGLPYAPHNATGLLYAPPNAVGLNYYTPLNADELNFAHLDSNRINYLTVDSLTLTWTPFPFTWTHQDSSTTTTTRTLPLPSPNPFTSPGFFTWTNTFLIPPLTGIETPLRDYKYIAILYSHLSGS
ncbi:hypothetical protein Pmani_017894 [Petrolisthes manimaculis]|uniref:Uncharacterized protein n=1 Tax=Petrolisthes manimaculis TaxID=1843537 RepID=A0AAE1PP34_9EUCA|nr:hypothetical protein Pmani_017894 [Petrolisthes manimaculis]